MKKFNLVKLQDEQLKSIIGGEEGGGPVLPKLCICTACGCIFDPDLTKNQKRSQVSNSICKKL